MLLRNAFSISRIFVVAFMLALIAVIVYPAGVNQLVQHVSHAGHSGMHGEMPMVEAGPLAYVGRKVPLDRSGWTATATDSQLNVGQDAQKVLDGNTSTLWHSQWSPLINLPHSITVDMKTAQTISGLRYQPRQDGGVNGTIGRYAIYVSNDNVTWSSALIRGTWADDLSVKEAEFKPATVRYVRLTAETEAGNRGGWSSAAEVNILSGYVLGPVLPRSGWTASASSSQADGISAAQNVLDGNATTIWHSQWSPLINLPHSITIDTKKVQVITGLSYVPRQDGGVNGNIGNFTITTSTDGITWSAPLASGAWADNASEKAISFTAVSTRFVRLTATSEAGGRGSWSSAAEINLHGSNPSAAAGGIWSTMVGFPIVPSSVVMLPNNKLLAFSGSGNDRFTYGGPGALTKFTIYDLNTKNVNQENATHTDHEMFCTGLAVLADGRVLVNGGSSDSATSIYDPVSNTWSSAEKMNIPRAYESTVTLSNGKVFTLGGSWYDALGSKNGEIYTSSGTTKGWAKLSGVLATPILTADPAGVYRADNHAWLFGTTNGSVFHAGPSKQMNWISTTGNGSITSAGLRADSQDAMNGNAVMYDINKILTTGGSTAYQDRGTVTNVQAQRKAYVIDISRGPSIAPIVTRTGDMQFPRAFGNSVVLPDGKVMILGGQQHPEPFTDYGAATSPELWDPATGKFTAMAQETIPRTYHSVAVLMADGRVFSGGGGLCGSCTTNHANGQLFTPPYLLTATGALRARPTITTAPASAAAGTTITVTTSGNTPKFALVRLSSVTHTVNTDQRRIPLTATLMTGTTYSMKIPADKGIALPGKYFLFALDASGTPSVARVITIN